MSIKEATTPSGWKCQSKAIHWSSMNDEDTLIPQGRLQLAQKTSQYTGTAKELTLYTQVT